eukprot:RCo008595
MNVLHFRSYFKHVECLSVEGLSGGPTSLETRRLRVTGLSPFCNHSLPLASVRTRSFTSHHSGLSAPLCKKKIRRISPVVMGAVSICCIAVLNSFNADLIAMFKPWVFQRSARRGVSVALLVPSGVVRKGYATGDGPKKHDLSALWEQHCKYEFDSRDVDATMATMVPDSYVNHIPTMTGGTGHNLLKRFYKYHFIGQNPADTELRPVSRTVGENSVVEELLFCFTHDKEIDWMLPGVPPTGKRVEIPLVAVVQFRDGKLYNEHIYWDQASVLVQIGKLDPTGLPVAGVQTARKLLDKNLPSNELMPNWKSSEGKPL